MSGVNAPNNDRDGRFKLRKNNEEVLRKIVQMEARQKCLSVTEEFGECAKKEGMWVVLNCRDKNRAMQDCLSSHYNEEIFAKYLEKNGYPQVAKKHSVVDRFAGIVGLGPKVDS
jgi:hypothetical protein